MERRYRFRKVLDQAARYGCLAMLILALIPLASVLMDLFIKGFPGLNWALFTELPKPVGETGGGMANAFAGSALLVGLASLFSIPVGVLGGIYLSEFGQNSFGKAVRFSADVMSGVPSIIIGVFVYSLLVVSMKRFSAIAGAVALAILMLPTIMRTTEELLKLVPDSLREAGLALGLPKWRVIINIVLRTGASGISTGVMLALARAAGETAPLLFTAFGSRFLSMKLDQPIGSLPVQIYTYAVSPYDAWHQQAWAAALALVLIVLVLNIVARAAIRRPAGHGR